MYRDNYDNKIIISHQKADTALDRRIAQGAAQDRRDAHQAVLRKQAADAGYSVSVLMWVQGGKLPLVRTSGGVMWLDDGDWRHMSSSDGDICVKMGGYISDIKAARQASVRKQAATIRHSANVALWIQYGKKALSRAGSCGVTWHHAGADYYMSASDGNVCVSLGGDISD